MDLKLYPLWTLSWAANLLSISPWFLCRSLKPNRSKLNSLFFCPTSFFSHALFASEWHCHPPRRDILGHPCIFPSPSPPTSERSLRPVKSIPIARGQFQATIAFLLTRISASSLGQVQPILHPESRDGLKNKSLIFFQLYWDTMTRTTCRFDTLMYCKMIAIIALANTSTTSHN